MQAGVPLGVAVHATTRHGYLCSGALFPQTQATIAPLSSTFVSAEIFLDQTLTL